LRKSRIRNSLVWLGNPAWTPSRHPDINSIRSVMRTIYSRAARAPVRTGTTAAVVAMLLIPLLGPLHATAQSPVVSTASTGMGHAAYDLLACGPDALAANPAALARVCAAPTRLILLPTLAFETLDNGAGGEVWRNRRAILDAIDEGSFVDAFDGSASDAILSRIPAEGYRHRSRVHLPLFQAGIGGRSALSLTFTGAGHGVIARDLAELALTGYEEGRASYSFAETDEWATGYWTLAVGHGRTVGGFDVGVTARAISGTFLTRWRAFNPQVDVGRREVSGRIIGAFAGDNLYSGDMFRLRAPDGFGWGIDVGAMRDVGPLRIGFAIQNVAHEMTWDEDIHLRTLTLTATTEGTEFDSDDSPFDPATASGDERQVAADLRGDAYFPRRMRASAALAASPLITLGVGAVFNDGHGDLDRDWDQRYSAGAMVRPLRFMRFTAGLATDLDGAREVSGGFELDLGRTRLGLGAARIAEPDDMGGWRVAVGLSRS
jgi:hypothetical protein